MFRKGTLLLMLLTVVGIFAAGSASPAAAQSDDVQVDPNSPAGTQYDIPVRRARREAQGKDSKSNDNPSLFGEGVQPDSGSSANADSSSDDSNGANNDQAQKKDDAKSDKKDDAQTAVAAGGGDGGNSGGTPLLATQTNQETSGSPGLLLAVLGIALALVAAATLSGWLIRRRS